MRPIGKAIVRHASTNEEFEILPEDLDFEVMGYEDRQMGPEFMYQSTVDHSDLGELVWQVWEYPAGIKNYAETVVTPHELVQNFTGFDFSEAEGIEESEEEKLPTVEEQIIEMVEWFQARFEDPAVRTPYESAEGGYIWIWGGPYDASDVLQDNFRHYSDEAVEAAVNEIQKDGTYMWAGTDDPDSAPPFEEEEGFTTDIPDPFVEEQSLAELVSGLKPVAGYPNFAPNAVGKIDLVSLPTSAAPEPSAEGIFEELLDATRALRTSLTGTNAHTVLEASVVRYLAALEQTPLSLEMIYSRGIRLEKSSAATRESIASEALPSLPMETAVHEASVLSLHSAFMVSQPATSTLLEEAQRFAAPTPESVKLQEALGNLAEAVAASSAFSTEAKAEVTEATKHAPSDPHPARSAQDGAKTVGSLVQATAKWVAITLAGSMLTATGIGGSVITSGAAGVDAAWVFLMSQASNIQLFLGLLGNNVGWARPISMLLSKIARMKIAKK